MSVAKVIEIIGQPFRQTVFNDCPAGFGVCTVIHKYSEVFLTLISIVGLFFFISLLPSFFKWSNKRPDGKKRLIFSMLAFVCFYAWLAILLLNSIYCFGFLAHAGPCYQKQLKANANPSVVDTLGDGTTVSDDGTSITTTTTLSSTNNSSSSENEESAEALEGAKSESAVPPPSSLLVKSELESLVECVTIPITEHESDLRNITILNVLIVLVLFVILFANIKEVYSAKALQYNETLCKKEDVQKFLSNLVSKPPEVGHYVSCFHPAKTPDAKTNAARKVITFSAIENFLYQSWRDFSDIRMIEPSAAYPIIEVEVVLNFFPGDHFTAEKYKAFVVQLTKQNQGKDLKINIDDYFHIEDHREWTFFIGNPDYISPWWDRGFGKAFVVALCMIGWPFRLCYEGEMAKHRVEIRKAVFCEQTSQDEGVSLSATPGSGASNRHNTENNTDANKNAEDGDGKNNPKASTLALASGSTTDVVEDVRPAAAPDSSTSVRSKGGRKTTTNATANDEEDEDEEEAARVARENAQISPSERERLIPVSSNHNSNASPKPPRRSSADKQRETEFPANSYHSPNTTYKLNSSKQPPPRSKSPHHPAAVVADDEPDLYDSAEGPQTLVTKAARHTHSGPHRSHGGSGSGPSTHIRETTTAVTHQDINGVSAVSTVALKDIQIQFPSGANPHHQPGNSISFLQSQNKHHRQPPPVQAYYHHQPTQQHHQMSEMPPPAYATHHHQSQVILPTLTSAGSAATTAAVANSGGANAAPGFAGYETYV